MKKNISHLVVLSVLTLCSSCVHTKYVYKNNYVARIDTYASTVPATDSLRIFKLHKPLKKVKIDNKDTYITFSSKEITNADSPLRKFKINQPIGFKKDLTNDPTKLVGSNGAIVKPFKYYFPEADSFPKATKLKYFDTKPVLQVLSLPLKIRPKLKEEAQRDSFPSQAEAGLNFGLAFGWKMNHNIYHTEKNSFGDRISTISFTPGTFLGSGIAELNKGNTRNPKIEFVRKAAVVSFGFFGTLGFNRINVGYATGWDFATGPGNSTWLYQGKRWHGIIIALDVIK